MLYQVEVLMLYNVQPTILTFVGKKTNWDAQYTIIALYNCKK